MNDLNLGPLAALVSAIAPGAPLHVFPMPGGASTRRYFRVQLPRGRSAVAMFVPETSHTEEIGKGEPRPWPFLEVRALLEERGIDVPKLHAKDEQRGWLLLEDLTDDTLAVFLARNPDARPRLYTRAVCDLARAQAVLADLPPDCIVASRAFDEDLLRWEIDHFREWGLDARGKSLSASDRADFDRIADTLARRIAAWPRGFTHRDYQSRNLMVRSTTEQLCWLDFQDALLGPRAYDLVALLSDSYAEFDRSFVEERLDEYAQARGLDAQGRAELGLEFDLITVQRKLKDAGRFVFIDRVKKNRSFLPFVAPTVKKISAALARLATAEEDMRALAAILTRALPEEV